MIECDFDSLLQNVDCNSQSVETDKAGKSPEILQSFPNVNNNCPQNIDQSEMIQRKLKSKGKYKKNKKETGKKSRFGQFNKHDIEILHEYFVKYMCDVECGKMIERYQKITEIEVVQEIVRRLRLQNNEESIRRIHQYFERRHKYLRYKNRSYTQNTNSDQ